MGGTNRGKQFEAAVRAGFELVPATSVDRLIDSQNGYAGIYNICDFIVYKYPMQYYIECKSCHGNTLSISSNDPKRKYGAISNGQWEGLCKKAEIPGVVAGYLVWFIDHDITVFVPALKMVQLRDMGMKSLAVKDLVYFDGLIYIDGHKKKVLWDYDFRRFFEKTGGIVDDEWTNSVQRKPV